MYKIYLKLYLLMRPQDLNSKKQNFCLFQTFINLKPAKSLSFV